MANAADIGMVGLDLMGRNLLLNAELGLAAPALITSMACHDASRSDWLPANLIQAQSDYFGAHTYERIDQPGAFHTHWSQE